MTWVEVASDAVKIGLGAFVGGVFAFLTTRQAHKIRLKEEYSRRRRDQLEKISEAFERVSRFATDHVATLHAVADIRGSKKEKEALLSVSGHHPVDDHEALMDMLNELHSIEARLALLAMHHISEEVEKYRQALTTASMEGVGGKESKTQREELSASIHTQRTIIFTLMALAYKNA
jgi:hypothetical protein